ncbi:uncharacterized protein Gasu_35200 [Galdieria sulphuraria]|uniref:Uncharacterized protein n=1 Tax=Galdieria sulphuraria TaxID=130081 RepID=M2W0J9_GALSU|nr:uncharacterized protein Gasu_35200 [Galdieria sulphuraria]EME29131.1 hypothetical protein Gasu_35200 [Galdieria sulphuraria]|eukprot:XP_005705651.1 hypothetical protein Gasu_35200 [Galdieria sulphuraria]
MTKKIIYTSHCILLKSLFSFSQIYLQMVSKQNHVANYLKRETIHNKVVTIHLALFNSACSFMFAKTGNSEK